MQPSEHRNSARADAKETKVQEMLQERTKLEAKNADLRIEYQQLQDEYAELEKQQHDQMQNTLDTDLDRVRHMTFG